jgi:hypothetical protein
MEQLARARPLAMQGVMTTRRPVASRDAARSSPRYPSSRCGKPHVEPHPAPPATLDRRDRMALEGSSSFSPAETSYRLAAAFAPHAPPPRACALKQLRPARLHRNPSIPTGRTRAPDSPRSTNPASPSGVRLAISHRCSLLSARAVRCYRVAVRRRTCLHRRVEANPLQTAPGASSLATTDAPLGPQSQVTALAKWLFLTRVPCGAQGARMAAARSLVSTPSMRRCANASSLLQSNQEDAATDAHRSPLLRDASSRVPLS